MSEGDISSDIEHIIKETHQILLKRRIKSKMEFNEEEMDNSNKKPDFIELENEIQ